MAIAGSGRLDGFVGSEPLSQRLHELVARTRAPFVTVHRVESSGALKVVARLRSSGLAPNRGGLGPDQLPGLAETGALDGLLERRTVVVGSGEGVGAEVPFMVSPITVGERVEGCVYLAGAPRRRWTCEDIAALLDARRAIEEQVRLSQPPATADGDRAEIVGVLGGMGPAASAAFVTNLVKATPVSADQEHLRVLLDSNPQIPDRTAFLLGDGPDPRPALLDSARRLRTAGATCLVLPCNTANVFAPYLAQRVPMSIVPWISTAVDAVPGEGPVGILATEGTIRSQVYQRALAHVGRSAVEPHPGERAVVMDVIYGPEGVKSGTLSPRARELLIAVARSLARRGAEQLLLACTELPLLLGADADGWPVPAIDPSLAMAQRLVNTLKIDGRPG